MNARRLPAALAGLLIAVAAHADQYDEFRIPDHHWRRMSAGFAGRWSGFDRGDDWSESTIGEGLGSVSLAADWLRDSEARQHRLGVSLLGTGLRRSGDVSRLQDFSGSGAISWLRLEDRESADRFLTESARVGAEWREYPWQSPWGVILSLGAHARWDQRWTNATEHVRDLIDGLERRYLDVWDLEAWDYEYALQGEVRIGRGRVRDATGVYQARLLADRLRSDGRLAREPSASARERLAALFYAEPGFAAPHDQPRRFFWREVERVLREDGALGEAGLDAFEALHAVEPLVVAGGRFQRPSGWFAGPLLGADHSRRISRVGVRSHWRGWQSDTLVGEVVTAGLTRWELSRDVVLAGGVVEWHRPLGDRTQLGLRSAATFDVEGVDTYAQWRSIVTAAHLIDERWYGWASAFHERVVGHQETNGDLWLAGGNLGVRYYLEDRWNLSLELSHQQEEAAMFPMPGGEFRRFQAVSLGIGWDTGALEAPGLFDPVRPLR